MNSKNKSAKKDLRLAYAQGNHSAYPYTIETNPRFQLLQQKNKNVNLNNNPHDKKGDKNRKKGDEAKSEDKDNNNAGTAGVYIGEMAASQNTSTTSNRSSIGTHVSDVTKPNVQLTQSIQDLLAAHPITIPSGIIPMHATS